MPNNDGGFGIWCTPSTTSECPISQNPRRLLIAFMDVPSLFRDVTGQGFPWDFEDVSEVFSSSGNSSLPVTKLRVLAPEV